MTLIQRSWHIFAEFNFSTFNSMPVWVRVVYWSKSTSHLLHDLLLRLHLTQRKPSGDVYAYTKLDNVWQVHMSVLLCHPKGPVYYCVQSPGKENIIFPRSDFCGVLVALGCRLFWVLWLTQVSITSATNTPQKSYIRNIVWCYTYTSKVLVTFLQQTIKIKI